MPFKESVPSGKWEVFSNGFSGVEEVKIPGNAQHRYCELAQSPDGSMYGYLDAKGRNYRILYH